MSTQIILKKVKVNVRTQMIAKKEVDSIPCHPSFLGHFARRYRRMYIKVVHADTFSSLNSMASFGLTFDGDQIKVRSISEILFFLH